MITRAEINDRSALWGLQPRVVEKDYVIGWALWGIGGDTHLSDSWAFKGGTCLKKCYIDTPRFSEDLDFTVLPGGPSDPAEILAIFSRLVERVYEESGLDFIGESPRVEARPGDRSIDGRLYYKGPLNTPNYARIKLDITIDEEVVCEPEARNIENLYSDELPFPGTVLCYSLTEVFAEKIRAMCDRALPRDLYDVVTLFRDEESRPSPSVLRSVYERKCESKGLPIFNVDDMLSSDSEGEMRRRWRAMLEHQLPDLPPFSEYWEELPQFFEWLNS